MAGEMIGFGINNDYNHQEMAELIEQHADRYIKNSTRRYKSLIVYTRTLNSIHDVVDRVREICQEQTSGYKIQISLGYILKNVETQELSFYYASPGNSNMFERPISVSERSHIQSRVIKKLKNFDWDALFKKMPRSGEVIHRVVYMLAHVYLTNHLMGECEGEEKTPKFIKQSRFIIDPSQQVKKCHKLCIFRCCVLYLERQKNPLKKYAPTRKLNEYFNRFCVRTKYAGDKESFPGVQLSEIGVLEEIFDCEIYIYRLFEAENGFVDATAERLPDAETNKDKGKIHLGLYNTHCYLLTNGLRALRQLFCSICEGYWTDKACNFNRHFGTCSKRFARAIKQGRDPLTEQSYQEGQLYDPGQNVFDLLERIFRYTVPLGVRKINFQCCWDSETYFNLFEQAIAKGPNTELTSQLLCYVLGVASNVPNFTQAQLFYADQHENPAASMIGCLLEISKEQERILRDQFEQVFTFINDRWERAELNENEYELRKLKIVNEKLEKLICQLPVFAFNFSRFDYRLLREKILLELTRRYGGNEVRVLTVKGQVKKITTPYLVFVDVLSYLGGKMSYDQWTFKILKKRQKLLFPYEYMDSLDRLEETQLPPLNEWRSGLKKCNILSQEWDTYQEYIAQGKTQKEALGLMKLAEPPLTGEQRLSELKREWQLNNFQTMRDYCSHYLKADLLPFSQCLEITSDRFFDQYNVNFLREFMGVPGLAAKVFTQRLGDTPLYIPSAPAYKLLKEHLVGGPSILFSLLGVAGETVICKQNAQEKLMGSAFSLDAGLLYGYCLKRIPCGVEKWRRKEDGFRLSIPLKRFHFGFQTERILQYYAWKWGVPVKSKWNGGEARLTTKDHFRPDGEYKILEDGEYPWSICIEVNGHGNHQCSLHPEPEDKEHPVCKGKTYGDLVERDQRKIEQLEKEYDEVKVIEICKFERDHVDPITARGSKRRRYLQFLEERPDMAQLNGPGMTESQVYRAVLEENITGFILCDWNTSAQLKAQTEIFPLFFKNVDVAREDCSQLQQDWFQEFDIIQKPQRTLTSLHRAEQHLISTDLAKFYLKMGAQPSNLQLVLEYSLTDKLGIWVDEACRLRASAAEKDTLLGETAKLLILSTYGRTLLNQDDFLKTTVDNENKTMQRIRQPHFLQSDYIGKLDGEFYFENRRKQKKVVYNSPIAVGNFILQAAKLHVLRMFYEAIEPNMDRSSYRLFTMQTDSLSYMVTAESFEEWLAQCVLPHRKKHLEKAKREFFVDPANPNSRYTAGLFKVEYTAKRVVGVTSKFYMADNGGGKPIKMAIRGVPPAAAFDLNFEKFRRVLTRHQPIDVEVHSFQYYFGEMFYQIMKKRACIPNYCKRGVNPDFSTYTLDL